jgi:dTDP-glucose 4,6-dehydratase
LSTIIVAGGSGYIGQEVVRAAVGPRDESVRGGHNVINIDIRPASPVPESLCAAKAYVDVNQDSRVQFIQADVSDPKRLAAVLDDAVARCGQIEAVCNLVGLVRYGATDAKLNGPNVKAVENLVRECSARNALFLQLSGTAVHGNTLRGKVKETDPLRPVEPYGRSKVAAERIIFNAVKTHGLRTIVFRATTPVGPRVQLSDLNKLYETVMNDPIVPAVRGSTVNYVSTTDIGRAFVYAIENAETVVPKAPAELSDVVFNLGVRESFSDKQAVAHLIRSIKPNSRKPIVQLPSVVAVTAASIVTAYTRLDNRVRGGNREPVLQRDLAKLFSGSHDHDQTKFINVFEDSGFVFKHPTMEEVLDVGTAYKFLTDWTNHAQPASIAAFARRCLAAWHRGVE